MKIDAKKIIIKALPFVVMGLFATKLGQAYRLSDGAAFADKLMHIGGGFSLAFQNSMPSLHPFDLMIGAAVGGIFKAYKAQNQFQQRAGLHISQRCPQRELPVCNVPIQEARQRRRSRCP